MRKLRLEELKRDSPEQFRSKPKTPITVVLDDLRSGHNVGAIFRSCDAFMVERIWLCGITPVPPHREITKSAIGATETVVWQYAKDAKEVIEDLKVAGRLVIGVEQTTESMSLAEWNRSHDAVVLIFGNEVNGIKEEILPLLDGCLEIQQYGTKHSLNVSVCAGIVLWRVFQTF